MLGVKRLEPRIQPGFKTVKTTSEIVSNSFSVVAMIRNRYLSRLLPVRRATQF
jgi:hypothetical protein